MERHKNIYQNVYKDTSKRLNGIWHVIFMWKGSVFKLIWHDILVFSVAYALLSLVYRTLLIHYPVAREVFEIICIYAGRFSALIPISFLTGFYVTQVVSRWWDQFMLMPWPDKIALRLVSFCPGKDHFRKNLRRTVMRYINLSSILVYRLVSTKVKERFPTYKEMVEARLILPHEVDRLLTADAKTPHESTWTPILWAVKLLQRARTEGKIQMESPIFANLISSIDYIEGCNRKILNYGWINFPLAYTQVASLSVFCYFFAALFGRQYLIPRDENLDNTTFPHLNISYSATAPFDIHTPDFYIPIFTYVELLSYMGWIKVAETLLNPFGDDDEDFQVNYMIDRNLQVSYLIVDEAEEELDMAEDPFMEAGIAIPKDLPAYVNKSSKAPLLSGDSLDLVRADDPVNTRHIMDRFKSLRLRRRPDAPSSANSAPNEASRKAMSMESGTGKRLVKSVSGGGGQHQFVTSVLTVMQEEAKLNSFEDISEIAMEREGEGEEENEEEEEGERLRGRLERSPAEEDAVSTGKGKPADGAEELPKDY